MSDSKAPAKEFTTLDRMEQFDEIVLALFKELLKCFPVPTKYESFHFLSTLFWGEENDVDSGSAAYLACAEIHDHAVDFLRSEGVVRETGHGLVLTMKGLAMTRGIPIPLRDREDDQSLMQMIRERSPDLASSTATGAAARIVSELFIRTML